MPLLTYALLLLNALAFFLEMRHDVVVPSLFALWPVGAGFEPWQIVTGGFLHANLGHLLSNMFGLWMFGRGVEGELGTRRFAWIYACSLTTASLAQLVVSAVGHDLAPTLGASGAVFGVLGAYAVLFPQRRILLLLPPVVLPAWLFAGLYALFELFSGVFGFEAGIAHFSHLGGLAAGVLLARRWRRSGGLGARAPAVMLRLG